MRWQWNINISWNNRKPSLHGCPNEIIFKELTVARINAFTASTFAIA